MDSIKTTYATFPFEWTVKSTSYHIQYRKAFNINDIDEILCSIINAKGNEINFSELGVLLGFNLQDLAEIDIFKIYLKGLAEYNLIAVSEKEQKIQLTEFGQEAIQSKLKYKYYYATTELFDNQTAKGETFDFSFKSVFDIENGLSHGNEFKEQILENPERKQKLQFQLFGNDIYKGEIVELYESEPRISYKNISLQSEVTAFDNSLELSIFKSGANKPEVQFLIELTENAEFKSKLLRQGMYHHILSVKTSITKQDIETYIDLWNWKEIAENPKLDWDDKTIFELFRENGDGSIWTIISKKAPLESIKFVIEKYAEYWNWTELTNRFDNNFIKEEIDNFNWDFEELSYKESELVQYLLIHIRNKHFLKWSNRIQNTQDENEIIKELVKNKGFDINSLTAEQQKELTEIMTLEDLKADSWDWNYLSTNLPDEFIEKYIDDFTWDFYLITEIKSDILRNLLSKGSKNNSEYAKILLSKSWNWKFISKKFDIKFLYNQIPSLAERIDWHTVLNRFFNNEETSAKCLKDESFKTLLKHHLPENYIIAHQKYLWSLDLIDFFENQNLIQWETKSYIQGFDTNENVEWSNAIFQKHHNHITTESGFLNVSQQISDYRLINDFSDFAWNWEGISQNRKLISNTTFIEKAFHGELSYSNNLLWNNILSQSTFDVLFWNKNLEAFYNTSKSEKQAEFWKSLTRKEKSEYIFANKHFPWDWSIITENSSEETIIDSYEDEELFEKWDWKIATRKIDKETVLELLEDFAQYLDWKFLIKEVFTVENELAIDKQLPKIAACLTVLDSEKRKEYWKDITSKFQFETLFPIVQASIKLDVFEWDWDFISNHKLLPTDIATLQKFKNKINWTVFSESKAIQQKFNPSNWDNYKKWEDNTDRYLVKFADNWDWSILSKNQYVTSNLFIISKHKGEKWDWEYLSEFGGFLTKPNKNKEKYLVDKVVKQFLAPTQYIKLEFLSKRKDVKIESKLILETKDKNWDWQVLSENEKAEISIELILELKDKNWNWQALSKRKNIEFSNETLLQLLDKDWDWNYLSENTNLEFNAEFIEKTKSKSWNWKLVSRQKSFSPSVEILTLTKDYDLDWECISKHLSLNPTKEILAKFENKWHWQRITEKAKDNFDDIDFLERFADKWNWRFICESGKLTLNNKILNKFKEHLEWNLISSNTNIHFTKDIIQEFYELWNWTNLKNNKRIEDLKLSEFVIHIINGDPILFFIDKITEKNSRWNERVFHFTNIDNAIKIIKDGKIKSRKTAEQLSNESGILTHKTRKDPEKLARFYFRTSTPTQFYNEGLGLTPNHPKYNTSYRELGYPKCPIMIYFRISLQEILFKNKELAHTFLSSGNMQRNRTKYGKLKDMISLFHYDELFQNLFDEKNGYYSQQELMFELDVSILNLSSLEVICEKDPDKELLERMLGSDKNKFKIRIDNNIYESNNDRPLIIMKDEEVQITSNYNQEGYFLVYFENFVPNIANGDIIKIDDYNKIIYFKSFLTFPITFQDFKIEFFEEIENIKQKWILGTQKDFKFEHETYNRKYFQY